MTPPRFPTRKLALFLGLSLADLALTWHLLSTSGPAVRESNPVAAWWLEHFGWAGLAGFKAAMTALTAGIGAFLFLRRPPVAHRLLSFACAAVAVAVLYSGYLCDAVRRRPFGLEAAEVTPLMSESDRLDTALRRSAAHREVLRRAAQDLRERRCTLEEAVARLAETEVSRDPRWLETVRLYYPDRGDAELLALCLLNQLTEQTPEERRLRDDLRAEFRALYGRPAPPAAEPGAPDGEPRPVLADSPPPRRRASAGPSAAPRIPVHGRQQLFRGRRLAKQHVRPQRLHLVR